MSAIETSEKGINQINEDAQAFLGQRNIKISNKDHITAVVSGFMKATIDYLDSRKQEGAEVELNILQLFDIGIAHEETEDGQGEYIIYVNPGQDMKLLCKDDEDSED